MTAGVDRWDEVLAPASDQVFQAEVEAEARRIAIQAEAATLHARRSAPAAPPFDAGLLRDILTRPQEPPYRVADLIPSDAGTLIVAQRKTGKTTLMLNLARCLLTGEDFLGRYATRPVQGNVAVLNYEVSAAQLARWAADVDVPDDRLLQVNLRGRRNPLQFSEDRAALGALLREHDVNALIVDPFGRAFHGKSQNDAGEVGSWLADLDRFARSDVGANDVILAAHAGWDGERTRGASALEDWADSIITMVRGREDDAGRYLRATGRDVDLEEDRLEYDPSTRGLILTGAGSRAAKSNADNLVVLTAAVVDIVTTEPGINGSGMEIALKAKGIGIQKGDGRKALAAAVDDGRLRVENGSRGAKRYFPTHLPRRTPTYPDGAGLTYPDPTLIGGVRQRGMSTPDVPRTESGGDAA